ncbi:TIGR00296 family protein [Candidatus Woesearchaeota archaeon]|nr:TIGR00296 family protein [Candidatus Woesearchaeota archaeon]
MISLDDGKILIKLARHSIDTYFSGSHIHMPEADKFKEELGVFVTLNEIDKLRGCIGFPEPVYPLKRAVIEAARAAAFKDPRFPPVTEDEMEDITIEISVLTKPKLIEVEQPEDYLGKIEIGKHGLIIRTGWRSGLLLPQVFTDYDCTPKKALEMTCQKAGLDDDYWKSEDAKIYSFSAQIFEEEEPEGKVVERPSN